MSVEQLYEESIRPLPAAERLRLAARILHDLASDAAVDESDEWTEEDFRDFAASTWRHIDRRLTDIERA